MTLIFLHIPKTGGTALSDILRQHYSLETRFDHESYLYEPMAAATAPIEFRRASKCVFGHYVYGEVHPFFDPPFTYFTMLRDPVERVLSTLSYTYDKPGYEYVQHLSLEGRIRVLGEAADFQTYMLAGGERDFNKAAANLRNFAAVGVTELFDQSLRLFQRTFGWPDAAPQRVNETHNRIRRDDIPTPTLRLIEKQNEMDRELHALAGELLREAAI